ncbi:MAG: hypothetical protein GC192_13890 [Bacteroidetes bacterium]|nr:hypothetical protein [Bacteroidota bacterium]
MNSNFSIAYIFSIAFLYLLQPSEMMAQQVKNPKTGFEIGFDALPYLTQIGDDIPGFRKDWEVFFKSRMDRGGFRIKLGHYNNPIHDRKLFKVVHVTDACVDGTDFKNIRKPYDFYFGNYIQVYT